MKSRPTTAFGAEEAATMTGKEVMQAIVDGRLPPPPIAKTLSFWLAEIGDGFAAFEGETGPQLLNPLGTVHGGWILTLIDSAATCACQSLLPAGVACTTVETKANFSRPLQANSGRIRVEARVITEGRQILTAEARATSSDGRIVAHGTSTVMVLQPR